MMEKSTITGLSETAPLQLLAIDSKAARHSPKMTSLGIQKVISIMGALMHAMHSYTLEIGDFTMTKDCPVGGELRIMEHR